MKSFVAALITIAALTAAPGALAQRSPVPIVDHAALPVTTGSGKPASSEALKNAIIAGGAASARKWDVVQAPDGTKLRATYKVRSHTVMVDIVPGATSYSVKYADSVNMKYGVEHGKPVIHPFYNRWVQELVESINRELRKL